MKVENLNHFFMLQAIVAIFFLKIKIMFLIFFFSKMGNLQQNSIFQNIIHKMAEIHFLTKTTAWFHLIFFMD